MRSLSLVTVLVTLMGCSSSSPLYELTVTSASGTEKYEIYSEEDIEQIADQLLVAIESGQMKITSDGLWPSISGERVTTEPLRMDLPEDVKATFKETLGAGPYVLHSPAMEGDFEYSADLMTDDGWSNHCSGGRHFIVHETLKMIHENMESSIAASDEVFKRDP